MSNLLAHGDSSGNVTYLHAPGGKSSKQPKYKGQSETDATNSMSPDEECKLAFHNLVDAKMKGFVAQLKCMDREEAEIVMEELSASLLRVKRCQGCQSKAASVDC